MERSPDGILPQENLVMQRSSKVLREGVCIHSIMRDDHR